MPGLWSTSPYPAAAPTRPELPPGYNVFTRGDRFFVGLSGLVVVCGTLSHESHDSAVAAAWSHWRENAGPAWVEYLDALEKR